MNDIKPLSEWESDDTNFAAGVIWWTRLDKRFLCEVVGIGDREGELRIFDKGDDYKLIHTSPTSLAYGAVFGPDVDDVARWQQRCIAAVDAYV